MRLDYKILSTIFFFFRWSFLHVSLLLLFPILNFPPGDFSYSLCPGVYGLKHPFSVCLLNSYYIPHLLLYDLVLFIFIIAFIVTCYFLFLYLHIIHLSPLGCRFHKKRSCLSCWFASTRSWYIEHCRVRTTPQIIIK